MNGTIVTSLKATRLEPLHRVHQVTGVCMCVDGANGQGMTLGMFGPGSAHCLKAILGAGELCVPRS